MKNHTKTALTSYISKGLNAVTQLFVIRVAVEGLGVDQFAVFALMMNLLTWSQLADLGLGLSLQNSISRACASNQDTAKLLQHGRIIGLCILASHLVLSIFLAPMMIGLILEPFDSISGSQKAIIIIVTFIGLGFTGVASIEYKILYGLRRGYIANLLPIISYVLVIIGISGSRVLPEDIRLLSALASYFFPGALVPLLSLAYNVFASRGVKIDADEVKAHSLRLFRPAVSAFAFALMTNLALQLDSIVISRFLEAEDLVVYTILSKTIGTCYFVYVGILMAVWPSITEMAYRSDWESINQIAKKTLTKGLLVAVVVLGLAPMWVPKAAEILSPSYRFSIPASLVYLASFCQLIRMWTDTFSVVLQSTNTFVPFWYFMPLQVILNVFSQVVFSQKYGLAGIYIGLIVSSLATVAWGLPWFVSRVKRQNVGEKFVG